MLLQNLHISGVLRKNFCTVLVSKNFAWDRGRGMYCYRVSTVYRKYRHTFKKKVGAYFLKRRNRNSGYGWLFKVGITRRDHVVHDNIAITR